MTDTLIGRSYGNCPHCNGPLDMHDIVKDGVCKNAECRRKEAIRAATAKLALKESKLQDAATKLVTALKKQTGFEKCAAVLTPSNNSKLAMLPSARRKRFADHITLLLEQNPQEALPQPPGSANASDAIASAGEPDPVSQGACANCRGHCCQQGNMGNAFVSRQTVDRCLQSGAANDSIDLYEKYMSLIPDISYEESCVYHTDSGCALPRQLRSDVCNNYLCDRLRSIDTEKLAESKHILFVAETNYKIRRSDTLKLEQAQHTKKM